MGSKNKKLNYDFVKQQFATHGCLLLEKQYINANTPMKYICACGEKNRATYGNFNKGKRCKNCGHKKAAISLALSQNDVIKFFRDNDCKLIDQYTNNTTPMQYICCCGNISKISFSNFKKGKRCQKCWNRKQRSMSKFTPMEVKKYFSDHGCTLLDNYLNTKIPVRYICTCGHESKTTFNSFQQGRRCKHCRQSKGERKIESFLKTANYKFTREYKHPTCKNKKSLFFDFAIHSPQGLQLIEYQGRQHYEPVNFGSKKSGYIEEFRKTQKRDSVKREWCQKNKIPLLEISYRDFKNIESIIEKFVLK